MVRGRCTVKSGVGFRGDVSPNAPVHTQNNLLSGIVPGNYKEYHIIVTIFELLHVTTKHNVYVEHNWHYESATAFYLVFTYLLYCTATPLCLLSAHYKFEIR